MMSCVYKCKNYHNLSRKRANWKISDIWSHNFIFFNYTCCILYSDWRPLKQPTERERKKKARIKLNSIRHRFSEYAARSFCIVYWM